MRHNWRASLRKFCSFTHQFFPVALLVIFLLVYAKCNFASVFKLGVMNTEFTLDSRNNFLSIAIYDIA